MQSKNAIEAYMNGQAALFEEWKGKPREDYQYNTKTGTEHRTIDHSKVFIEDGVVCPDLWFAQSIRPLFFMKEAYGGEEGWNLVGEEFLLSPQKCSKMWKRVTEWSYGLFNTTAEQVPTYDPTALSYCLNNEWLRKIAVVNIKKSGGTRHSVPAEILEYAKHDHRELRKQIEYIDPTLIVCAHTFPQLEVVLELKVNRQNPHWFYCTQINGHDVLLLDFYHPANQYPALLNYYGLVNIYQQALRASQA